MPEVLICSLGFGKFAVCCFVVVLATHGALRLTNISGKLRLSVKARRNCRRFDALPPTRVSET